MEKNQDIVKCIVYQNELYHFVLPICTNDKYIRISYITKGKRELTAQIICILL